MEFCRAGEFLVRGSGLCLGLSCPGGFLKHPEQWLKTKPELSTGINTPRPLGNSSQNLSQITSRVLSALLLFFLADGKLPSALLEYIMGLWGPKASPHQYIGQLHHSLGFLFHGCRGSNCSFYQHRVRNSIGKSKKKFF